MQGMKEDNGNTTKTVKGICGTAKYMCHAVQRKLGGDVPSYCLILMDQSINNRLLIITYYSTLTCINDSVMTEAAQCHCPFMYGIYLIVGNSSPYFESVTYSMRRRQRSKKHMLINLIGQCNYGPEPLTFSSNVWTSEYYVTTLAHPRTQALVYKHLVLREGDIPATYQDREPVFRDVLMQGPVAAWL